MVRSNKSALVLAAGAVLAVLAMLLFALSDRSPRSPRPSREDSDDIAATSGASTSERSSAAANNRAASPRPQAGLTAYRAAWEAMERIDLELHSLQRTDYFRFWEQNCIQYAQIDLDRVDARLCQLIRDWVKLSTEVYDVGSEFWREGERISKVPRESAQLGAVLGSTDRKDPEAGAFAGAILFGSFGSAIADKELKDLQARYQLKFDALDQRITAFQLQRGALGKALSQRHVVPFHRRQ